MTHIISIVGARPQFVKAAVVSRSIAEAGVAEQIIHTGQHYDAEMSAVFFDELGIGEPAANLGVGSGSHAVQTGEMMIRLEAYLLEHETPAWLLVYGDTNSTLAAALVGAKLHIPVAHVEAGLRSFNRRMPEEINRVVTDHLSDLCLCPTETAVENLRKEGVMEGVHLTGDVMYDATLHYAVAASERKPLKQLVHHAPQEYYLATVHRAENTDDPGRLRRIFEGFSRLDRPVVLPLHPRTRARLESTEVHEGGTVRSENVEVLDPAGYLAMLTLVKNARAVLTDSGGLQKEAVWLGVPCITLRDETEWIETLEGGWNRLVGADDEAIVAAVGQKPRGNAPASGDPGAGAKIVRLLKERMA